MLLYELYGIYTTCILKIVVIYVTLVTGSETNYCSTV